MQDKKIINYGNLEKEIVNVEDALRECDTEEKLLVLKMVQQRLNKQIQQLRAQEMSDNVLSKIPLGGLLKKFNKQDG